VQLNFWALSGVVLVVAATTFIGQRSSRFVSSTDDFLVARRTVRSRRNAAAISGEYLSAASFLGVAGTVLKDGVSSLWYPIGFTAGYLALMLFVAAPLRRSGAYTLPDFVDARLESTTLRRFSTFFVVFIGILYMVPQLQAAGTAFAAVLPVPLWLGAVVVTLVITVNVISGGMRAITVVQAFQYWVKLFALAAPTFVLCMVFFTHGTQQLTPLNSSAPPVFPTATTVEVKTPVTLQVGAVVSVELREPGAAEREVVWPAGANYDVPAGSTLRFAAGAPVPVVTGSPVDNASWLRSGSDGLSGLLTTYSIIIATFLGTMGLPHVLARFYTNPDGRAARRTTVHVLLLLGLFYLFPTLLGAMSRLYVPQLLVTGKPDTAILLLPSAVLPGLGGQILGAIIAAGAFAAFLATSSGLLVSIAGVLSTDVLPGRVRDFRSATLIAAVIPLGLAILLHSEDLALSVGMSFAFAASTFCPLLVLGIWWRRLTWQGAMLGMIVGGGLILVALVVNIISSYTGGWAPWFSLQPAIITVPAAFFTAIMVSLATKASIPFDVNQVMLGMHAPDPLGFVRNREVIRFGRAEDKLRLASGRHRKDS
jgi:Na+(H+)/acetate symporter ActP